MTISGTKRLGFQDVRREVVARIQAQVWPSNTLLPSEVELAREFGCARATVNRALRELADEGLIDRKRKRGTMVNPTPARMAKFEIEVVRKTIEGMNADYRYSLVQRQLIDTPEWLRGRIGLDQPSKSLHLLCMHYANSLPFQFEERWIVVDTVPSALDADFSAVGPNEWLIAEMPFSNAEISFTAVTADAALADFLGTEPGASLFRMERATWFQGNPVTFVRMTFHAGYRMNTRY